MKLNKKIRMTTTLLSKLSIQPLSIKMSHPLPAPMKIQTSMTKTQLCKPLPVVKTNLYILRMPLKSTKERLVTCLRALLLILSIASMIRLLLNRLIILQLMKGIIGLKFSLRQLELSQIKRLLEVNLAS